MAITRGVWHQLVDRSQKVAAEQIGHENGVGCIISPRDIKQDGAVKYAQNYASSGAAVLFDPQYHMPGFTNPKLGSYATEAQRLTVTKLLAITPSGVADLVASLESENAALGTSAVISPAVLFEAGRADLVDLNETLHGAGCAAASRLGKPVVATAFFSEACLRSPASLSGALAMLTKIAPDGYYVAFEFGGGDLCTDAACLAGAAQVLLTLATSGRPVLHGYAGPHALLGVAFGASSVGLAHFKTAWHFKRTRFQAAKKSGGGGDAPSRTFSRAMWGAMIHPDETALLSAALFAKLAEKTPFSAPPAPAPWDKWTSYKHLLYILGTEVSKVLAVPTVRGRAVHVQGLLGAAAKHGAAFRAELGALGVQPKPDTDPSYQLPWANAVAVALAARSDDYDLLDLIGVP